MSTRVIGVRLNKKTQKTKMPWLFDVVELEAEYQPLEGQTRDWVWVVRSCASEKGICGMQLVIVGERIAKERGLEFDPSAFAGGRVYISDLALLAQTLEPE
jgi:hypothetical protein